MYDSDPGSAADGTTDLLTGGVWEANLSAGMGERATPAVFEGLRLPD